MATSKRSKLAAAMADRTREMLGIPEEEAQEEKTLEKPIEAPTNTIEPKPEKTPKKNEETVTESQGKPKSTVYGFRASEDNINRWKAYTEAAGMKVSDFGTTAINEYISNHPLTEEQKEAYNNAKTKAIKSL